MTRQISITTNDESFNIIELVDGVETLNADFAYNGVWVSRAEDTLTIMFPTRKFVSAVNGLYNWYTIDNQTYASADALQEALESKLFHDVAGGGGGDAKPTLITFNQDEMTMKDANGNVLTYAEVREMALDTEKVLVFQLTDSDGLINYLDASVRANSVYFSGWDAKFADRKVAVSILSTNQCGYQRLDYAEKSYVDQKVAEGKGMTEDEARTVAEALNDLDGRANGLDNRVTALEEGGGGVSNVWIGTQSEYDAIATKEENKVYIIRED